MGHQAVFEIMVYGRIWSYQDWISTYTTVGGAVRRYVTPALTPYANFQEEFILLNSFLFF